MSRPKIRVLDISPKLPIAPAAGDIVYFNGTAWVRLAAGSQGAIEYMGASSTLAWLAPGTSGHFLQTKGAGNNPVWASAGEKSLWVPVTYGTEMFNDFTFPVARLNAATEVAYISFRVPGNFISITTAIVVVNPQATQAAADWDISSTYAAVGEAINTHVGSDTATTYNVTLNQLYGIDISGILSALAANDYVGIKIIQSTTGHDVNVLGIWFVYT